LSDDKTGIGDCMWRPKRKNMKNIAKRYLILILLLGLAASASAISTEEEIRLGAEAAGRFEREYGLVNDPAMQGRLNRIGQRLLTNAERKDLPWRFGVINIDAFNAAAFPGGFIYATKGLMQAMNDEELAFVIGHEIGHVDNRHSIKQLESAQMRRLGLIAIALGAGGGNIDQNAATLVQLTDAVIGSKHSRSDEEESDRYGMRLMAGVEYDPAFALSAFQKLASQSGGGTPGFLNTLLGSHPLPEDRIAKGAELVTSIPYSPEVMPPVNQGGAVDQRLFQDASSALEYTLSLQGQRHRDSLQTAATDVALGRRGAPGNTRVVRVVSDRSAGLSGLENALLARPEFDVPGQAFGAAVIDAGGNRIEAVVLLQGGY
jgi:predicted Zn-dependent protease